jgi:hypothetical protein
MPNVEYSSQNVLTHRELNMATEQKSKKPKLAKGIKVPTSVKLHAAMLYPLDRTQEKAFVRASAAALHANETRAKSRGKDKNDGATASK